MALAVIVGPTMGQTIFKENWDTVAQGGDAVNTFTTGALFTVIDAVSVDGSRCQYNDPDPPVSHPRDINRCRPSNINDWHVHLPGNSPEAKSFSGDGALHLGVHKVPGDASFDSYTIGALSQAVSPAITIGASGAILTFWHILQVADDRTFSVPPATTVDRGVVQVAPSDTFGNLLGPWQNATPFLNGHAKDATGPFFDNCIFDPTDDGSTEDDFFSPFTAGDPIDQAKGPSSTCAPQVVFPDLGDWTSTDVADVGSSTEPGSLGNMGTGVWVQSRFDLTPFSGQTIKVRFLFTGIELTPPELGTSWDQLFGNQLGNAIRGWIIDDFEVPSLTGNEGSIEGTAYVDDNPSNGVFDTGETGLAVRKVQIFDSSATLVRTTHTDNVGLYRFGLLAPDTYTVSIVAESGEIWTPTSRPVVITAQLDVIGEDFGRDPVRDLLVALYEEYPDPLRNPCTAQQMTYCVNYSNTGSFNETTASVSLQLPPPGVVTFVSSTASGTCTAPPVALNSPDAGNLITWNIATPFAPNDSCTVCTTVDVVAPLSTPVNATANAYLSFPTQDSIPTTPNTASSNLVVACAIDPNDKQANHGCGPAGFINNGQELTYRIRFQNSGNFPASRVIVSDVLSPDLDITTLELVDTSHTVTGFDVFSDRRVVVTFNNIGLPPEETDPEGSQGFVLLRVTPLPGLAAGTVITNNASIFFDLNAAVVTNTVKNTITLNALPASGIAEAETCADGIDNDCDSLVDEIDLSSCGVGACTQTISSCVDASLTCDPLLGASPELCDGLDNDCNSLVDEGLGLGATCDGLGACGTGILECDGAGGVRCSTDLGGSQDQSTPEVCDGLDNDCNGAIDDIAGSGLACQGVGACGPGVLECGGLGVLVCSTNAGGSQDESEPEACNNVDDDCDGTVDEFSSACGVGACAAAGICSGGLDSCTPGVPAPEVCDGLDNDCDGLVDEDPPLLTVTVSPEELWPPNHRMVEIDLDISATGLCGPPTVQLVSAVSNEPDNGEADGDTTNDIQITGTDPLAAGFQVKLRAERQGSGTGRLYTLIFSATDSGGVTLKSVTVLVRHDRDGEIEPLAVMLNQTPSGSEVSWNEVEGAQHYNVIRGLLRGMDVSGPAINLGAVDCLAAATSATLVADADLPPETATCAPGVTPCLREAFVYLVEYRDGADSGYGTESVIKPRLSASGDCP